MLRETRFSLTLAGSFAVVSLILNVLVLSGRWRGEAATVWELSNFIPFILSLFIAGNPHSGSDVVLCTLSVFQWATIGYVLGRLLR